VVRKPREGSERRGYVEIEGLGSAKVSRASTPSIPAQHRQAQACPSPAAAAPKVPEGVASDCQRIPEGVASDCQMVPEGVASDSQAPLLSASAAASLSGIHLFLAALGITNSSQEDAQVQVHEEVSDIPYVAPASDPPSRVPSPLTEANENDSRTAPRAAEPAAAKGANVEENKDPNTEADFDSVKAKANTTGKMVDTENVKPALKAPATVKEPLASATEALQNMAASVLGSMSTKGPSEQGHRGSSPRLPPNSWYDKSVVSPEETWLRLDGLRVRMEMLPGGLVIERDTNITELSTIMADIQSGHVEVSEEVSQSQAYMKHAEILVKVSRLSELVEAVESEYWRWCTDPDAAPLDMVAKGQVHDWLVGTGEKAVILTQLRDLGARRCLGPGNPSAGLLCDGEPCRKFLQYGLYKAKVRRCPTCSKESKRLTAISATEAVRCSIEGAGEEAVARTGAAVTFTEAPASSIPVEARELAWAQYGGCPNTYFRGYVLPSDYEIAKENGTPAMVSWLDGDRRYRSVPTDDVIMMDHQWAFEVRTANAAYWNKDQHCLMPRSSAAGQM